MAGNANSGFASHPENINRNGRPKKGESITDLLRETVDKQALVDKLIEIAIDKGDIQALKYAIDRMDGKPIETVNQNVRNVPDYVGFTDTNDTEDSETDRE